MDYVAKFMNFFSKSPDRGGGEGGGLRSSRELSAAESNLQHMTIFILHGRKCVPSLPEPPYPMFHKPGAAGTASSARGSTSRGNESKSTPKANDRAGTQIGAEAGASPVLPASAQREPSPSSPAPEPHRPVNWGAMTLPERTRLFIGSEARKFLWFSYRSDFEKIPGTSITTDSGWGCTLRTGQMMLANAFLLHFLGAEWQSLLETPRVMDSSHKVLKWFADSPSAPYSIQAIALLGDREFQKPVGDWHGPNTVAHILARLTRRHQPAYNTIRIHVALDGVLAKNGVYASDSADDDAAPADAAAAAGDDDAYEPPMPADVAAIILIPLRLGVSVFNMVYAESLLSLYALPEFLGFIGGRPSASYYFVGCQVPTRPHHLPPSSSAEIAQGPTFPAHLLYLDPHTTQPFVDLLTPNAAAAIGQPSSPTGFDMATLSNTATFRFPTVYRMQLSQIDPSLTLGFYTRNRTEFNALCEKLHPIVSAEHPPFVITEDNLHTQSTLCNDASDANQEDLLNFELGDDFQMDDD